MSAKSGHCRHYAYEGRMICRAGVDIGKVHGNALACLPNPKRPCDQREEFTAEEVEAENVRWKAIFERMVLCLAALPGAMPGTSGHIDCPACKTGRIDYVFSPGNGHCHARCTTPECFEMHQ